MRLALFGVLFTVVAADSQVLIPSHKVAPAWREMNRRRDEPRLECQVGHMRPSLNFSFRFQTGYVVNLPLKQYRGKGNWFGVLVRVTPEAGREPSYLFSRVQLPEVPQTKAVLEFGGGFVIGEGKYKIELLLMDNAGRVCTDSWQVQAKLGRKEREVKPGMEAGEVDEISLRKWTRGIDTPEGGRRSVSLLLNAAPMSLRRVRLGGYDRVVLISALASILERLPVRKVRLVVFSMDQQKEVYRSEDFQASEFGRLTQALNRLELGVIDYETLQNRRGHVGLLAGLLDEALNGDEKQDAVILLSPPTRYTEKVPAETLPAPDGRSRVFYLQFRSWMGAVFSDTVANAVRRVDGKKYEVYSPAHFASALAEVIQALAARDR